MTDTPVRRPTASPAARAAAPRSHAPSAHPRRLHGSRLAAGLSVALAGVTWLACALTLFVPDLLTGPAAMNGSARGTAWVAALVAVPVLVASVVLARSGAPGATVTWLGSLGYLAYNAVLFVAATPANRAYLAYVAMLALAIWSVVALLWATDVEALAARWSVTGPRRALAWYVWVVVTVNALLWLRGAVPTAVSATGPADMVRGMCVATQPLYVQDLAFWLPLMAVSAAALWRRQAWGVLLVGAGLLMWVVESVSIAVDQSVGAAADPGSSVASSAMTPPFLVLAAVGLVPLVAHLRAFNRRRQP
jgi:hypothetical protein